MASDTYAEFRDAVNMTASELEKWLTTDESTDVGQKPPSGGESVGHDSGRKIIEILHTKRATCAMRTRHTCGRWSGTCTATWRSAPRATWRT
ncbi:uncharacterized protein DUF3140 [Couchioplanes caeruleus]|uniref:Uncharacterized protein DUF3140 n=1 Tax=Couchioplanes caeruleus TaxID=56438 RepID=A0A3N1GFW6_9ACTN|nr:uncharacterized protein DUF3140 [Couchioplanes caeruleus]